MKSKLSLLGPIMQFFVLVHGVGRLLLQGVTNFPRGWQKACKEQGKAQAKKTEVARFFRALDCS